MLNLNVDVNITAKRSIMPIYFINKNECCSCGAIGALKFIDIFGREVNNVEIHPFDHIKCSNCNRLYSIEWRANEEGELKPIARDPSIKLDFTNAIKYPSIKKNGVKELE